MTVKVTVPVGGMVRVAIGGVLSRAEYCSNHPDDWKAPPTLILKTFMTGLEMQQHRCMRPLLPVSCLEKVLVTP